MLTQIYFISNIIKTINMFKKLYKNILLNDIIIEIILHIYS